MNVRVSNKEIEKRVDKWGVDGVNENGKHMLGLNVERRMLLDNRLHSA